MQVRAKYLFLLKCFMVLLPLIMSAQQVSIQRIGQMPDLPQPYLMRDWKQVAQQYDSLVFDLQWQGQFLPVVFFRPESVNYPNDPSFGLHTAIGTISPGSGEAINVIPAVVGASLCGIDKSNQFGHNWVLMCQEFFNNRPDENIYLNHPVTSSGHDWWYETMPNIFYLQLRSLYPDINVFDEQLETMATQWYNALGAMDASATPWTVPYMNYRAWNMSTMSPLATGVPEPEAAGAIAWIMYQTYLNTGKQHYKIAAEWALEYLNSLNQNPSYELQLPYGVYTAARMNAENGTLYDIEKMLNWVFDRGHLRGWGTIVGNWGGFDCSGLVGEANDQGNDYAFMMNGYQHAAALVPMVRYDDRFATSIAKWVLNLANASRLFYPDYLPADQQDNFEWSQLHDPQTVIGYEALREVKYDQSPYATGDGVEGGWSQTNLMLYGSSHVGYLASLLEPTNVEGILQIDLLKTDFHHDPAFPTFLYYNPFETDKTVILQLDEGTFDIYDALSNTIISTSQSGEALLDISAGTAVMTVLIPAGAVIEQDGKRSLVSNVVIDYNNGHQILNHPPRIKALTASDTLVEWNKVIKVFCTAEDADYDELSFQWWIDTQPVSADSVLDFYSDSTGEYVISAKVIDSEGQSDSTTFILKVVEKVPIAPEIISMRALPRKAEPSQTISLEVIATDANDDELSYAWFDHLGNEIGSDSLINYVVPSSAGDFFVYCLVTDTDELHAYDSLKIMIREPSVMEGNLIARYLLDGNTNDNSGNNLHGTPFGEVIWSINQSGEVNKAACFDGSSSRIHLPSDQRLNFTEGMSISLKFRIESTGSEEQFLISHGSWQNRYKISISNNRIRFTINTTTGIADLDSESIPETDRWYHLAVVYNGQDMELWINGKLDAFKAHAGSIRTTTLQAVLGQQFAGDPGYNFFGCLDNVSIYDYPLSPEEINQDQYLFLPAAGSGLKGNQLYISPNPITTNTLLLITNEICEQTVALEIINLFGQLILSDLIEYQPNTLISVELPANLKSGLYLIRLRCGKQLSYGKFLKVY